MTYFIFKIEMSKWMIYFVVNLQILHLVMSMHLVKFEVEGKVQGVFFRKLCEDDRGENVVSKPTRTKEACDKRNVSGYVLNTTYGTVQGELQGSLDDVKKMKHWLANVGSSKSRIDSCKFLDERTTAERVYRKFSVIRDPSEVSKRTFIA